MKSLHVILIFLLGLNGSIIAQYQFPNDAIEKLRSRTMAYADMVEMEPYIQIEMNTFNRTGNKETEIRNSQFVKNEKVIIIKSEGMSFFIDDSLFIMINDPAKKIYIREMYGDAEIQNAFIKSLVNSFDSILFYTSSVIYNERKSPFFQIKIAPENYYMFDNLQFQNVYYSPGEILPDSIVKGYYDEVPFEEFTSFNLVSTKKSTLYPYTNSAEYIFEGTAIRTRYKSYIVSKL